MKHWMSRGSLVLLTCLAVGCGSGSPAKKADGERQALRISFDAPQGWKTRNIPNQMFPIAFGPADSGFAPNINIVRRFSTDPLHAYVSGNLDVLTKGFKEFRLLSQEDFKTAQGLRGVRLITEDEQVGRKLRQTYYFFGKGDIKFVVTCTTLADGGDKLDQLFESSMKTVHMEGE